MWYSRGFGFANEEWGFGVGQIGGKKLGCAFWTIEGWVGLWDGYDSPLPVLVADWMVLLYICVILPILNGFNADLMLA
jgi:hypothetical protein